MVSLRPFVESAAIVAVAAAVGIGVNLEVVRNAFASPPPLAVAAKSGPGAGAASCSVPQGGAMPVALVEVEALLAEGVHVLDARPPELYANGHIPGAISIPAQEAASLVPLLEFNVPRDAPIVVYCRGVGCLESANLAACLTDRGYTDVRVFKGGFSAWHKAGLPVGDP